MQVGAIAGLSAHRKKKKGGNRKRGKPKEAGVVLPLDKCLALIGKIYQEKSKTDQWIARKTSIEDIGTAPKSKSKALKKLRFDAFIMKYFTGQHGTRGIARRHLRNFVVSLQHHAKEHPRVDLFRKLSGVPQLNGISEPYIPTLVGRYFIPLLNHVVEGGVTGESSNNDISKLLNKETMSRVNLDKVLEKVQVSLAGVFFGSRMFDNYKRNLASHCVVVGHLQMVDLDKAMDDAYSMFVYSDGMRAFSHVRGARCLQRWFRGGVWPPRLRMGEEEETLKTVETVQTVESNLTIEEAAGGGGGHSSPRQKILDAQKIDADINGPPAN